MEEVDLEVNKMDEKEHRHKGHHEYMDEDGELTIPEHHHRHHKLEPGRIVVDEHHKINKHIGFEE